MEWRWCGCHYVAGFCAIRKLIEVEILELYEP